MDPIERLQINECIREHQRPAKMGAPVSQLILLVICRLYQLRGIYFTINAVKTVPKQRQQSPPYRLCRRKNRENGVNKDNSIHFVVYVNANVAIRVTEMIDYNLSSAHNGQQQWRQQVTFCHFHFRVFTSETIEPDQRKHISTSSHIGICANQRLR